MPSRGVFYGLMALLVAMLVISSSLVVLYYGLYQQKATDSQQYATELNGALTKYRSLASSFSVSLKDYNQTIGLLSDALANLNTSTAAYINGSAALPALWNSYLGLAKVNGSSAIVYEVDMKVDYGNGTARWYNNTAVQPGWNGYLVTLVLLGGRVQASWYPPGYFGAGLPGEHFVSAIGGVKPEASMSWFVWTYEGNGWTQASSGADGINVHNGTKLAWTLCSYDSNFNPTCRP